MTAQIKTTIEASGSQQSIERKRPAETSPMAAARLAGLFFLLTILAGIVAQMAISGRLVVEGDAAATAANIMAHRDLYQLGLTVYLIEMACQITMTALFYSLLKPVSGRVALLAAFFSLTGCTIKTLARLFYIAPLFVLGGASYLTVFSAPQLQALALLLLKVNDQAAGIALVFFGFSTVLNGILIFKSTFLPRFLGVFSIAGGLGWLMFLYPPLGDRMFSIILLLGLVGGLLQIGWLLIKGVDGEQWQKRAAESA